MAHLYSMQHQLGLWNLLLRCLLFSWQVDDHYQSFSLGQLGFPLSVVATFLQQVPQETGSRSCPFLKAKDLETDQTSLPAVPLVRQSTENTFKGRRCRPRLSMGAVPKNLGLCFNLIIERNSHFDSILQMRKLSTEQLKKHAQGNRSSKWPSCYLCQPV